MPKRLRRSGLHIFRTVRVKQKGPWTQIHGPFCVELTRYTIPVSAQMQTLMTPVTPLPPMKPETVKVSFLSHFERMCMMENANTLPSSFVLRLSPCSFSVTLQKVFLTFGEICVLLVEGEMVSSAKSDLLRYMNEEMRKVRAEGCNYCQCGVMNYS